MDVVERTYCSEEGCDTRLRRGNLKRGTCDLHDEGDQGDATHVELCVHGHALNETGWTLKGFCFACSQVLEAQPPTVRYFEMANLNVLRRVGLGTPLTTLAAEAGVSYSQMQRYAAGAQRASEARVARIAAALGVTEDELKGTG